MKFLKENARTLIMCICEIMAGVLLLMNPTRFTSLIIITLGVILTLCGITGIIIYFRTKPELAALGHSLSIGLVFLTVGLFCVFHSEWFLVTFPVLTLLYGVAILFAGIMKVQWMIDSIRLKGRQWFLLLLSAALSLISGFIIITNPFASTLVLWTFVAISLITGAVFDILSTIFKNRMA